MVVLVWNLTQMHSLMNCLNKWLEMLEERYKWWQTYIRNSWVQMKMELLSLKGLKGKKGTKNELFRILYSEKTVLQNWE